MSFERKILNALLDSYENSLLASGKNKVAVHISFKFTKKSIPEYFDESSQEYDLFHACLKELEDKGFLTVEWKYKKPGNIVQKVILNTAHVDEVYRYLKRTPKAEYAKRQINLLISLKEECRTPAASAFIEWLLGRIKSDLSVKEYFELQDIQKSERLIRCTAYVEGNGTPCYYREFSIRHFGDSKAFEGIKGTVRKIICRFKEGFGDVDERTVFAEYGIYDTPDYVYIKGEGIIGFAENPQIINQIMPDQAAAGADAGHGHAPLPAGGVMPDGKSGFNLNYLRQGIGISGDDLEHINIYGTSGTKKIITIENLTTFFCMREPDSLLIYLGGYHNHTRRRILKMIYAQLPDAEYLHSGDIDAGGFGIYEHLCEKTGIPFKLYRMGVPELKKYGAYTKALTANDRERLEHMLAEGRGTCPYQDVIEYMLEHGVKLEQECIRE